MTGFELWIKACEEYGTKIFCLDEHGETGLYKTWNEYEFNHYFYRTPPVFHVWNGDKRIYCGLSYQEAERMYQRCQKES